MRGTLAAMYKVMLFSGCCGEAEECCVSDELGKEKTKDEPLGHDTPTRVKEEKDRGLGNRCFPQI